MLIPRIRTPGEMAELMKRTGTIQPRSYTQFGATAPAFFPETDEPLLVPHQTYYQTQGWQSETARRSVAELRPHSAIGSPVEWNWAEELERRTESMRPYGRGELGQYPPEEGYVAVPRRLLPGLGVPAVPPVHEYTAVPRRIVTGLGAPWRVPPSEPYVAVPRRYVTALGGAWGNGEPPMQYSPDFTTEEVFRQQAATVQAKADRREYDLVLGGLNAANIFSQAQITLPAMTELLRGAVLYAAKFKGDTKFYADDTKIDLGKTPLEEPRYLSPEDFNTKVRWGIALIRFFLANPDKYGLSVYDASLKRGDRPVADPSYWWCYENFTGLSNYVPPPW